MAWSSLLIILILVLPSPVSLLLSPYDWFPTHFRLLQHRSHYSHSCLHHHLPYFPFSAPLHPHSSAKDQLGGTPVAIKKIMKPFSTPVLSKRTYRELKLLKHLRHENVSFTSSGSDYDRTKAGWSGVLERTGQFGKGLDELVG